MNLLTWLGVVSMMFVAAFTYHAAFVQAPSIGQSPRLSIIEAWVNIVIGFSINIVANFWLVPLMMGGGHLDASANFWGGWIYTTISIVRQFSIRRWFNNGIHKFVLWLAGLFGERNV